jgi:hypothetical protein
MKVIKNFVGLSLCALLAISACTDDNKKGRYGLKKQNNPVPEFSATSAYDYIQKQVDFGPREPNSEEHAATRLFLIETLRSYAGRQNVFAQNFEVMGYEEEPLRLTNILAGFNTTATTRILLAAHWDTRPRAEEDQDPDLRLEPILGADDGGSGVGVLLELARIFSENPPPIGIDFILFDGEDYGHSSDLDYYFLGARHWSANPPVPGYSPRFAILLDMVGGVGAQFPKEGYSTRYASKLVDNIWQVAKEMGHGELFIDQQGGPVADDHLIVNQFAGIPMINIIHYYTDGRSVEFAPHWHTHNDTMDIISVETLQAVGDVLLEVIYNRIPPQIIQ